jgi:hypothetical protein
VDHGFIRVTPHATAQADAHRHEPTVSRRT